LPRAYVPNYEEARRRAPGETAQGARRPIDTREHECFADLFNVERKKCAIWVHRTTLLGFVRPAVIAAELEEFHPLFRYEFRTALASMALPESFLLDRFDVSGAEWSAPTNDRAVVGSMLHCRKMFEVMVGYEGGLEIGAPLGADQRPQRPRSSMGRRESCGPRRARLRPFLILSADGPELAGANLPHTPA
jgi:hypothetical protein